MKKKDPSGGAEAPFSERRIANSAGGLFFACFLAYTCSYLGRKNLSACLPAMIAEGLLDKAFAGYVTTAYMLCYGIGQAVSGTVATRVKPQYLIGTGLFGAGLCNLCMSVSGAGLFPVIWALNGVFHSMLWAPIIRVFTDRLPKDRRARAGVNISAACSIGAVLAYLIPALILKLSGWRTVFMVSGGVLLLACGLWIICHRILRDYILRMDEQCAAERAALQASAAADAPTAKPAKHSLLAVIAASGLCLMLFALVCNGALRDAVETWAPTFLSEQFGLDESLAALCSVLIPLITLAGPYAAEALSKRVIRNEIYTAAILFGVAVLCITGIYLSREVSVILCAGFMAMSVAAMFGANHLFLTVVPYHFAPLGLSAAVSGFFNSVIYLATALFSSAYGLIAERCGWGVLIVVWLCIGLCGILFSLFGGRLWKKKAPLLDEGRL